MVFKPSVQLLQTKLVDYWKLRMEAHYFDTYRGRPLIKLPEDLRVYQHIIEETQPEVIVELGTYMGGSAVWFADQLRCLTDYSIQRVVTVGDEVLSPFTSEEGDIVFINGDHRTLGVLARVTAAVGGRRAMVVDDSAHTFDVTLSALTNYSGFVSDGCYFVVEDGVVDVPALTLWPDVTGVQPAIEEFLSTGMGSRFSQEERDEYVLTMHFGGWLKANGSIE